MIQHPIEIAIKIMFRIDLSITIVQTYLSISEITFSLIENVLFSLEYIKRIKQWKRRSRAYIYKKPHISYHTI